MPSPTAFNVLRKAGGDELVLAADFAAAGRPIATFTELVAELRTDQNIWETAPAPYGQEVGMSGADQADRWAQDVRDSGLHVHAVLGFCTGSVYAAAIADRVAGWQEMPAQILIDPEPAERELLVEQYGQLIGVRLGSVLSPAEVHDALEAGRKAFARGGTLSDLATDLTALCRAVAVPGLVRLGMPAARSVEFVDLFTAYQHWFAATSDLDTRQLWKAATALNGNTPGVGLDMFPPHERDTVVARAIYFDVAHNDLMRRGEVAQVLDELLSGEGRRT